MHQGTQAGFVNGFHHTAILALHVALFNPGQLRTALYDPLSLPGLPLHGELCMRVSVCAQGLGLAEIWHTLQASAPLGGPFSSEAPQQRQQKFPVDGANSNSNQAGGVCKEWG
ncbi:hypothetical protein MHYP_G00014080 [Metynnis hypsauchen]